MDETIQGASALIIDSNANSRSLMSAQLRDLGIGTVRQTPRVKDARVMKASFAWKVLDIGVKVAALMTEEIIARRLPKPVEADKIMLPGRCRADLDRLSERFGVPFVRGPDELKDIPGFFGRAAKASDMTKYDIQIFAEIVDASALSIEAILARAEDYVRKGANVIDLGGLPDTPFPHLEQAVKALKAKGYRVSVDSADPEELLRGGKAGADFLLSLNEDTLAVADQVKSTPVLIPKDHGDLRSLYRAMFKGNRPILVENAPEVLASAICGNRQVTSEKASSEGLNAFADPIDIVVHQNDCEDGSDMRFEVNRQTRKKK